jgi:hypothetical protein
MSQQPLVDTLASVPKRDRILGFVTRFFFAVSKLLSAQQMSRDLLNVCFWMISSQVTPLQEVTIRRTRREPSKPLSN